MRKSEHSALEGKKVACIINPSAANKKWKRRKLLRRYLQENLPGQIYDSHENKLYTIETAKRLSLANDIIVAAGGDGTIADVIQGILSSENQRSVALGIIPLGS
ncbi:MAG: acylglycerol kinase family protein, partial [Candidatus Aminicenantes bacterium]|nr:acylglycerol kinase family protein [Candidatus Aminicenantes bacterium]